MSMPDRPPSKPRKSKLKHATWEHPKASGIKVAEIPNKTAGVAFGVSYQVRIPSKLTGGKRELLQRSTKHDAELLAEDRFVALKKHGTEFSKIPASAQREAAMAWGILSEHNKSTRLELTLIDVVRAGMSALSPTGGLKTFAEVAAELRASKASRWKAKTLDVQTERSFRKRSELLEATLLGPKLVSQITSKDIVDVLSKLGSTYSSRSILNYRNIASEILRHAVKKRYSPTNPFDGFTKEDYKGLGGEKSERALDDINILSVLEAGRLLRAAQASNEPGMLATTVLRLFCGIRTGEVSRLEWTEVHWLDPKPYVHIPAGKAKKRQIRHVEIPPNALAWLQVCNPPAAGRIDPKSALTYAKRFGRISKLAGIGKKDASGEWVSDWESNDTRHSFGSYDYALHGDAIRTARLMGHKQGDDVLFAHYRSLVTKEEAEKYFGLAPDSSDNVEKFPASAVS
jgi:integrase